MKQRQKLLTDEQWELIEALLPPPRRRPDNRGSVLLTYSVVYCLNA
jgi:transposase